MAHSPGNVTPPAKFEVLVMSLAMQARMDLGLDAPAGYTPNLDMARHAIDMLGILQDKTKGNLSSVEKRTLDNTVTELRFEYSKTVTGINSKAREGRR